MYLPGISHLRLPYLLQLHFLTYRLGLVMQTVERRNHITVFRLTVLVRQLIESIARNGHDARGVVDIHLLLRAETIDNILYRTVHFILELRRSPEKDVTVGRPHWFYLTHLVGRFIIHKVKHRRQSRIFMIFGNQCIPILAGILHYRAGRPLAATADSLIRTLQSYLAGKLIDRGILRVGILYRIHYGLADEQGTVLRMLRPPFHQCLIIGCRMSYLPVYLRYVIIYPALARPQKHIGIQIIVVLQSVRIAAQRVAALVAIDTERTYSELHPGLQSANRFMYLLNQNIHVAAAPVSLIAEAAAIARKARVIRKVLSFDGIRIEIIVHVNATS